MPEMSACPICGGLRTVVERDATSVLWHCGWCQTTAREEHDLIRAGLQREWSAS